MEERSEIPLICFTLFAPAAAGASAFSLPLGGGTVLAAVVALMVTAGMLASVAHLARPLRAPRSLAHWKSSWLSREIIAVSAFWALAVLWLAAELLVRSALLSHMTVLPGGFPVAFALNVLAAVAGVALVPVIAKAYRVHGQPAWNGSDTLWELAAGAIGSGGVVAATVASWQCVAQGGVGCVAFGCCSPLTLSLIALLAVSASGLAMGHAQRLRIRRVSELAERGGSPRARAARDALVENPGAPRVYLALDSASGACALVACIVAALFGQGAVGGVVVAAVLTAATALELSAQAVVRNRFYTLAQHARYAVRQGW